MTSLKYIVSPIRLDKPAKGAAVAAAAAAAVALVFSCLCYVLTFGTALLVAVYEQTTRRFHNSRLRANSVSRDGVDALREDDIHRPARHPCELGCPIDQQ